MSLQKEERLSMSLKLKIAFTLNYSWKSGSIVIQLQKWLVGEISHINVSRINGLTVITVRGKAFIVIFEK